MPKRQTPIDYRPPALDIEFAPFDEAALERVIAAARLKAKMNEPDSQERIRERLNGAAMLFKYQQKAIRRPSPSDEEKTLKSIASASTRLEKRLPIEWEENGFTGELDQPHVARGVARLLRDELDELMQSGEGSEVADCIEILAGDVGKPYGDELLLKLAAIVRLVRRAAAKAIDARVDAHAERGLVADKEFAELLINIYADLFDRDPGRSRDAVTNEAGGPLIRFVQACYAELGESQDEEPLYGRIGEILDNRKAPVDA